MIDYFILYKMMAMIMIVDYTHFNSWDSGFDNSCTNSEQAEISIEMMEADKLSNELARRFYLQWESFINCSISEVKASYGYRLGRLDDFVEPNYQYNISNVSMFYNSTLIGVEVK